MNPPDGPPSRADAAGRREYLSLLLGTGTTLIAGCTADSTDKSGDADDSGSRTNGPSKGEQPYPIDRSVRFQASNPYVSPSYYNWNPFAVGFPEDRFGIFAQWTQYLVAEDRFHPHLIQDWTHSDGEFVLTISEKFAWSKTGEDVTAGDLAFQLSVYDAANHVATRFVDDAQATDEFELTISYPAELNAELVEYTVLPLLADIPPSNWEDAAWEDDPTTVQVEDPDASGPLALAEVGNNSTTTRVRDGLEDFADHNLAANYNWGGYEILYVSSEWRPFDVDGTDGVIAPEASPGPHDEAPDTIEEIEIPSDQGLALWFNHDQEPWTDRVVRKAFLHTIDPKTAIDDGLGSIPAQSHPAPTGLTSPAREEWLGANRPEGFSAYDGGAARGEELLAEAGYEPGDLDITIAYSGRRSGWASVCLELIEQLQSAGWTVEGSNFSGSPRDGFEGDFDVVAASYTPSHRLPREGVYIHHPFFPLEYIFSGDPHSNEHFAKYDPGVVTVDGSDIDVSSELETLRTTSERADQRPVVQRLARVINHDVPCGIIMDDVDRSFIDTEQFTIPDDSTHLHCHWPQWWLPKVDEKLPDAERDGLMKYRGG